MWPFSRKRKPDPEQPTSGKRRYAGAKTSRLLFNAAPTSADTELYTSHAALRDRSRALCRDNPYAKRAKELTVNNIIGPGMGLQAQVKNQRHRLLRPINDGIERAWLDWSRAEHCHTGGSLHFADFERAAMGEVFEAGEVFIRIHARAFGGGRVPIALELIESERIADDHEISATDGRNVTMGIEHDAFARPTAYYIHKYHPNQLHGALRHQPDEILRVPADQIIHLRSIERWPQTRGVPWLHAAIERLHQHGEYENAALVAARIGASKVGFFESPDGDLNGLGDEDEIEGAASTSVSAGEFTQLPPGYKFSGWDPSYPNDVFEPFTRASLRGIAAATGPCYESISRDYSQSNYSSSRLALIDDRDLWQIKQRWWIRSFREPLHRRHWLQAAVLADAIPEVPRYDYLTQPEKYSAVNLKPRGWSWVDPTKEVKAYKEAEQAGYTTKSAIIAATAGGMDLGDVIDQRRAELDALADAELRTDTTADADAGALEPSPAPDADQPPPDPPGASAPERPPSRITPIRGAL